MNHSRRPIFILCALMLLGGTPALHAAAKLLNARGPVTVSHSGRDIATNDARGTMQGTSDGKQTAEDRDPGDGSGVELPPGTVVKTGEDGTAIIELAPGVLVELQPNTEIVIGDIVPNGAVDAFGNGIDLVTVTVNTGTITTMITDAAIASTGLSVITPRGTTSPTVAGQAVIIVTGINPETAVVTIASIRGSELVTTEGGETIPVGEGLSVILRPGGQFEMFPIDELPNGAAIRGIGQAAFNAANLLNNLTPVTPPSIPPSFPPDNGVPPNQPPAVPTPTPSPPPISP